ncbi:MAG: hypothetical protein JW727_04035 [Candidatus Aenigmarchaeota archaeon]|nr:hypothetical protein [Candidatus Aenigmarchaeota archaeon]
MPKKKKQRKEKFNSNIAIAAAIFLLFVALLDSETSLVFAALGMVLIFLLGWK